MAVRINRRRFVGLLAGSIVGGRALASERAARAGPLRVDAARLQATLEALSTYGRPAGGTFADGVSRVAYSDADVAGRAYVAGLMRDAGLAPRVDPAGNLCGRRPGRRPALKPILLGSHIDSVPSGGNFDGPVGSMAAIEVVRTLNDQGVRTEHPVEIALWSNEEGGTVGSDAAIGALNTGALERRFNGITLREGLRKIGGDPDQLSMARRLPGSLRCYLELHIEQGGVLDQAGIPIGVVDGIVSIDVYEVEIRGFANHAGTTPMGERQDALLAAARLTLAVREVATARPGRQVGTVGHVEVLPNAENVIPGLVRLSIEFRDLSAQTIAQLGLDIKARAQQIARDTATEITLTQVEHLPPALADPGLQRQIEQAASALGLKTMHLPSGAGHDAQVLARLAPMGMIFVPSIGGISHSPRELSHWSDVANGADVLLQTVLAVDKDTSV